MDHFDIDPEMATILDDMSDEELLDFAKLHQDHTMDGTELYIYILFLNFTRTGSIEHLESAVLQAEGWIAEIPNDHPHSTHRSSILDLLVANVIHTDERKNIVGVDNDFFESLGIGVENSENLHSLINSARAMIANPEHPQRNLAMQALSLGYKQLFLVGGDLSHLSLSIEVTEEAIAATFDDNVQQAEHFTTLAVLKQKRFDQTKDLADLGSVIDAIDMAVALTPYDDYDNQALRLDILGKCLGKRSSITREKDDLDRGIEAVEKAVKLKTSQGHDTTRPLLTLDALMLNRWILTEASEDLDHVLETRDLMLAVGIKIDDQAEWLYQFSTLAEKKFKQNGAIEDINRAVEVAKLAVKHTATEDSLNQILHCDKLARLLRTRFDATSTTEDLNQIIEIREAALTTTPDHTRRPNWLIEITILLKKRFERKQDIADLDRAISLAQLAAKEAPHDDLENYIGLLSNVSMFLKVRYQLKPTAEDLNEAIETLELALKVSPEYTHRHALYSELATWMLSRFDHTSKSIEDIDRAVEYAEMSIVDINLNDSRQLKNLTNLGALLGVRFAQTGQRDDLSRAVEVAEMAADALSPEDPERPSFLLNFAYALDVRYGQTGQQEDLKRMIETYEVIVTILSPDSPEYAASLSSFAVALSKQFELTESTDDLARAIKLGKMAANSVAINSNFRSACFLNLGRLLELQYERTRNPDDQDSSIEATETALAATAENDSFRILTVSNLASSLIGRFESRGKLEDLNRAVEFLELALSSTPVSFHIRYYFCFHLSRCHKRLFEKTGKIHHLNQSVEIIKTAVDILSPSNANRARVNQSAGLCLLARHSEIGESKDLDEAYVLFKAGLECDNSIPIHRIQCADNAAKVRADQKLWRQSTIMYEAGLNLLPLVSPRSINNSDKQYTLKHFAGLAARGTGAALNANRQPSDALTLLELGRGVIAGLILEMRTDITELREKYPELARQFTALRDELDAPIHGASSLVDIDSIPMEGLETKRTQETDQQFKEVIAKIRELPNFEEFLLPPTADQIKAAAGEGPIAVINVSPYRCDAFLITCSQIRVLELPNLHERDVNEHAMVLNAVGVTSSLLEWLWNVIARPVLEALEFKQPPSDDNWPHLWWIPTGALSQLPLHASGYHFRGSTETVLDRVISSYSSSVKALIYGRRNDIRPQATSDKASAKDETVSINNERKRPGISLLVGMSKTPGLDLNSNLPYAEDEVKMLDKMCLSMGLETVQPPRSREEVLKHMSTCRFFHFAGHGQTNPSDPSRSCLLLDDWKDNPLTVGDLRDSNMQNNPPFLAYLSACSTGANKATELFDEGIHLISAFQLAGFRHVIGTLWEVSDSHCVDVARVLYETIRDEKMTDKAVSRGLHRAVRALRDGYVEERRSMEKANRPLCDESASEIHEIETKDIKRAERDAKLIKTEFQNISQENPQYWAPYVHFGV
jgi:hypothetical protein